MSVAHQFATEARSGPPPFGFAAQATSPVAGQEAEPRAAAGHGRAPHPDATAPLLRPVHLPRTEPAFDDEIGTAAPGVGSVPRYGSAATRPRVHGHHAQAAAAGARGQEAPGQESEAPQAHAREPHGREAQRRDSHGRDGAGIRTAGTHTAAHPAAGRRSAAAAAGPALRLLPGGRATPGTDTPAEPLLPGEVGEEDITEVAVQPIVILGGPAEPDERDEIEVRRLEQLPDPHPLAGQLAQAVVEVLSGDRPITQLLTWLDEQIYLDLSALAPKPRTTPTVGQARVVTIRPQDRPKIRSIHVCRPADGVAEVAARVETNGRSRAVALRLQEWRGRWRCSALVVG